VEVGLIKRFMVGATAASLLIGCDGYAASEPPPEIAEACMLTMIGGYQLPATEWVKPLTDPDKGRWQVSAEHGVIFRGERFNPLNETTSVISILLAPQPAPANAKAHCKRYFRVSRVDLDGVEQALSPFLAQLFVAHWSVLATYPSERFSSPEPLTLDWAQ
jgi:hypothetical protein